jgi:hypothetical protein
VNLIESTANSAQPSANPHKSAPMTAFSSGAMNGAATRRSAARSPAANEPVTTQPMWPFRLATGRMGPSGPLSFRESVGRGVAAIVGSIPVRLASSRVSPNLWHVLPSDITPRRLRRSLCNGLVTVFGSVSDPPVSRALRGFECRWSVADLPV